ncbi:hypothetical protein BKA61DRAFT_74903 [Leptodontidium sp. MPI-SDFR-AT-0119]|nr:hypothetical protein BKA61DRAFT_74903 [Leptodontidium sp. MPI-SDFR-AT-0119]
MVKIMLALASSHRDANKWNRLRFPFATFKLLILLNLPATFAQASTCSKACSTTEDTAFNIPSAVIYGAVAHNAAVCNNEPYLRAVGRCIVQNCGQQDTDVTIGLFINGCISTGTPTQYSSQELLAWAAELASSSPAVSTTSIASSTGFIVSTVSPTASPSTITVGTSGSAIIVSVSTPTASVVTIGVSPTAASSSTSSNTPASSKQRLSGGAIAGIVIGAVIALVLIALLIFLLSRDNRKHSQPSQHTAVVADDFGKEFGNGKVEMDSESKPVAAVAYISVSSQEKPTVAPTSNTQDETSTTNATMNEGPPISPTSIPAELSQDTSATVTSPHQELPTYYAPHFEMAADTPNANMLQAQAEPSNNSYQTDIQRAASVSPSTISGAARDAVGAGVEVMRAPDEELAWLEAEEEKIRKRRSELQRLGS